MNGDTVQIVTGKKIRTWGGWYRHDTVLLNGVEIGRIQVKRRPKCGRIPGRVESLTLSQSGNAAVIGTDVEWLKRQYRQRTVFFQPK